nr:protein chromatin remodeling 4-like isoform X1 [Tanacetum cinerariifolium]
VINKVEPSSKRARPKIIISNSGSKRKSENTNNVAQNLTSTDLGSRRSSRKAKSLYKAVSKVETSSIDGSPQRSSSSSDLRIEEQTDLEETKSSSLKGTELEENDEKPKTKRDRDRSKGKKVVSNSGAASKKRKYNAPSDDVQKKSRTDKEINGREISQKGDKVNLEVSGKSSSQGKGKSIKHGKTKSLSKNDMGNKTRDVRSKDKMELGEGAKSSHKSHKAQKADLVKHSDHAQDRMQQVDRVLGCRIQGTERISADSVTEADKLASESLMIIENEDDVSEKNPKASIVEDAEILAEGTENVNNSSDQILIENDSEVEKTNVSVASTVDKLRSRLSKWKVKPLSIGGRLTLLKAVLGVSHLYNMSIFKVPKGILNSMEAIRGKFFNGMKPSTKKITLAAWNKVLASKENGGLDGSLWFRVIKALYGTSIDSHPVNLSSNWCSIFRELHLLVGKGFHFLDHCKKRIGNDRDTCFWYDNWLGDKPLNDLFPRLFALELNKEVRVADKVQGVVSSSFRRPVGAGSKYQYLTDLNLLMESVSLSHSCDRGILLESSLYPLCLSSEENIHHVLFGCGLAENIFRRICRWWELDWQALGSFSDWNYWFSLIRLSSKVKDLLEGVFCVAWGRYLKMGTEQLFNGSSTQAGKDVTENNDNKGEEIVGDPENDMLSSVKVTLSLLCIHKLYRFYDLINEFFKCVFNYTLDWNDEATEEQDVMESPVEVIDDDTA